LSLNYAITTGYNLASSVAVDQEGFQDGMLKVNTPNGNAWIHVNSSGISYGIDQ